MSKSFEAVPKPFVEFDPAARRSNPRPETPNTDIQIRPNAQPELSLVESFGDLVDEIRQLNTDAGLRPYRLFSVITRWSGGDKGRGTQEVVQETEVLPTPRVRNMDALRGDLKTGGLSESGTLVVDEISPRYSEDDTRAIFHCQPLPAGFEGFLELRMDARDGQPPRRRFVVRGVPFRRADKFDWRVELFDADVPRTRDGQLQAPRRFPR